MVVAIAVIRGDSDDGNDHSWNEIGVGQVEVKLNSINVTNL